MCVAQKKVGSVRGEIVFSLAPGSLDIDVFNANPNGYQENDICESLHGGLPPKGTIRARGRFAPSPV